MNDLIPLFTGLGLLAATLANIAIWSPRQIWVKLGALATTAAFLPMAYASLSTMLSRPKPIAIEWSRAQLAEASVLGSQLQEGEAIYVWLGIDGVTEPRAYALPWDEEMAKQLRGAEQEAQETGTQVRMQRPFTTSLDDRSELFYAAPPPPPPLKPVPSDQALEFTPPALAGN